MTLVRLIAVMTLGATLATTILLIFLSYNKVDTSVALILGLIAGGFGYLPLLAIPRVWRWVVGE